MQLQGAVPDSREVTDVDGHRTLFGTLKHELPDGTLVVFQAFVHTWSRPTYRSLGAVGRMYAEGLLIPSEGVVRTAPDELMWPFR